MPIRVTLINVPKRCRHSEALTGALVAREPQALYGLHLRERWGWGLVLSAVIFEDKACLSYRRHYHKPRTWEGSGIQKSCLPHTHYPVYEGKTGNWWAAAL